MRKICLAYYGDDHYNHERATSEWGRYYLNTPEEEQQIPAKQSEQLEALFAKKRIAWYKVIILSLEKEGDSVVTVSSAYHPLRQRIVLNEEAKADVETKKKKNIANLWMEDVAVGVPLAVWGQAGVAVVNGNVA